ncbi:MAG: glycosyltransferase [Actinomycetales bacterium]|nr:glycosyltransferase [Actinomycetales bacterium]
MVNDVPALEPEEPLGQLRRLGDEVRELASDLPGDVDDVSDLLEPRRSGASRPTAGPDPDDDPAELAEPDEEDDLPPRTHRVTAVIVAHDGARWLPAALTALARSTRRPERVVAVDTGSTDATPDMLVRAATAGLVDRVVTLQRDAGFGTAVGAALATSSGSAEDAVPVAADDTVRWVWLLHDDSAPAPTALVELLRHADHERSAEILGPKLRGWRNQDVLVECGVTVARSGNRVTGLERRELDQGQHDGVGDVLGVSSAGMLVRRDVWDELGGFDPSLPMFRDDVEFCWRARRAGRRVVVATSAVVHHREAATHGRRPVDAGSPKHPDRPARIDRVAAIHLMRSHATGLRGPYVTLRLLLGSLLRAVGLLLAKAPHTARDEWGAFRDAVRDRSRLRASRARVAAAAALPGAVPESDVRTLLAPRGTQARHVLESVADLVAGRETADASRSVLDSTTDDPDGWYAEDRRTSRLRRAARRPGVLLVLTLVLLTLVAVRGLLGDGVLLGGALLPAPEGAGDLWASYTTAWHEVGPGSSADSPAWLVPLTLLAFVLRGSATTAVDVLLLGLVPLAGLTAYLSLRGVVSHVWVRVWAAATYATLPAVTGAISGGRIGTAASIVLLPWLVRSCARLVGVGQAPTWRRAFGTALLLAVTASFTPVVWLVAVPLAVVAGLTVVRDLAGRLRLLVAVLLPVALLVPWSLRLVREPGLLWLEPGLVGPTDLRLQPYDVLALRPGGVGSTPLWLATGLLVAAVVALAVPGGRRYPAAAWVVGVVGLLAGVAQSVLRVQVDALPDPVAPWPGVATAIWGGSLIVASAFAVDRLPRRLAGASFGWRQPAAAVVAVLLLLAPAASLGLFVLGVDGPLTRGSREVLPAYVAAEMRGTDRPRSLVLRRVTDGRLVYDLLAAPEPQLGDVDVAPPVEVSAVLDKLVGRLAAGLGADEVDAIATHGIRYVVLSDAGGRDRGLVESLDSQRGLRRLSAQDGAAVWQVVPTSSRVQVIDPPEAVASGTVPVRVSRTVPTLPGDPWTTPSVDTTIPAGKAGRTMVVAEAADSRWTWTVDGAPVVPTSPGVTGYDVPVDPALQHAGLVAAAVPATVAFDGSSRRAWLWAEAAVVFVALLLALPSRRAEDDDDSDTFEEGPGAAGVPPRAAATGPATDAGPGGAPGTPAATPTEPVGSGAPS